MGCVLAITNHYNFRTAAGDYGLYNFSFWDFAHFHVHSAPMYGIYTHQPLNLMDDHFSITLFYLIPFYWLFNWPTSTYTLALIQVLFLLLGAWSVYKLVLLKSKETWLGVIAVLYYFLLYGHFGVYSGDFNIGVIAACMVPLFIYLFEIKRFVAATVIFVLILLSKEIMPIWFVFIMLVLIIEHRKERPIVKKGLLYLVGSAIVFALIFKVFIPLIHRDGTTYSLFNYSNLGPDPAHALLFMLSHPIKTCSLLFANTSGNVAYDGVKQEFYLVYLISGGFVLMYRPKYFLFFLPLILEKMLNDDPSRWSIELHYSIEIVTLLPLAAFYTIGDFKNKHLKYGFAFLLCLLAGGMTFYKLDATNHAMKWSDATKENILHKHFFNPEYNVKEIYDALSLIPADAKVSASGRILPHLSQRLHIYQFPDVQDADYIAVFTFRDYFLMGDSGYTKGINDYIFKSNWDVIKHSYDFVLFKKQPNHLNPADIITYNCQKHLDSVVSCLLNPNLNLWLNNSGNLYFLKEPNKHESMRQFTCNAEKVTARGDSLIASDNSRINLQGTITDEKVRNGKHSIRLKFSVPFGLTSSSSHVKPGDIVILVFGVIRLKAKG